MDQFRDKAKLAGEGDSVSYGSQDGSDQSQEGYFWDSRRRELLGRTISSWLKLMSFYFLYTAILAMLWGLCMGVFIQTLDFYIPKLVENTRNPGLGFRPAGGLGFKNDKGDSSNPSVYSSLIWFKHGASGNWQQLKENMDRFLQQYEPGYFPGQGTSLTKCGWENNPLKKKLDQGQSVAESCEFNKEWLSDPRADYKCIAEEDFGYRHGKPCIMLKLNRIYDWTVVPYTYDQIVNHTSMPSKLKLDIAQIWEENCVPRGYVPGGPPCPWLNMAWLHCDGENYADMENIGPVTYTPFRGFPGYYFPYRNQRGYLAPIDHDRVRRRGLTHFELIMD